VNKHLRRGGESKIDEGGEEEKPRDSRNQQEVIGGKELHGCLPFAVGKKGGATGGGGESRGGRRNTKDHKKKLLNMSLIC